MVGSWHVDPYCVSLPLALSLVVIVAVVFFWRHSSEGDVWLLDATENEVLVLRAVIAIAAVWLVWGWGLGFVRFGFPRY